MQFSARTGSGKAALTTIFTFQRWNLDVIAAMFDLGFGKERVDALVGSPFPDHSDY